MVIQSEIASGGGKDLGMVILAIAGVEEHPRIGVTDSMAILQVIHLGKGVVDNLTESSFQFSKN